MINAEDIFPKKIFDCKNSGGYAVCAKACRFSVREVHSQSKSLSRGNLFAMRSRFQATA